MKNLHRLGAPMRHMMALTALFAAGLLPWVAGTGRRSWRRARARSLTRLQGAPRHESGTRGGG